MFGLQAEGSLTATLIRDQRTNQLSDVENIWTMWGISFTLMIEGLWLSIASSTTDARLVRTWQKSRF